MNTAQLSTADDGLHSSADDFYHDESFWYAFPVPDRLRSGWRYVPEVSGQGVRASDRVPDRNVGHHASTARKRRCRLPRPGRNRNRPAVRGSRTAAGDGRATVYPRRAPRPRLLRDRELRIDGERVTVDCSAALDLPALGAGESTLHAAHRRTIASFCRSPPVSASSPPRSGRSTESPVSVRIRTSGLRACCVITYGRTPRDR